MSTHTIGFTAKAAGVGVDTVRYYEREGLLSQAPRTANGYRLYSIADVERLRFIRQAKTLGFTLDDITELLRLQDGGGQRDQVRAKARVRIEDLNCCCRLNIDHLCRLKIDQGWKPRALALGVV